MLYGKIVERTNFLSQNVSMLLNKEPIASKTSAGVNQFNGMAGHLHRVQDVAGTILQEKGMPYPSCFVPVTKHYQLLLREHFKCSHIFTKLWQLKKETTTA